MNKVKVVIVGAGNISNTRHIPALKKLRKKVSIVGVLSNKHERAEKTASQNSIANYAQIIEKKNGEYAVEMAEWIKDADAFVIGAPPRQHYELVKMALMMNKHVLVEKPMMMNEAQSDELIAIAKKKKKTFYVMHNFQYAGKMLKLNNIVKSKKYGEIQNITEAQFTNHERRLPEWYNDLPMGLFYDEAAHFMYLLDLHAGKLEIQDSFAVYDRDKSQSTPTTLSVTATAGKVPVSMLLNFRSPVCEWYYIVNFKKRIVIYDFFKDILIDLPTDNEHLAIDVLKNNLSSTWQFWTQFITNGVKMIMGNLLYGHDVVLSDFADVILGNKKPNQHLTAESGRENVRVINEIINKANKR